MAGSETESVEQSRAADRAIVIGGSAGGVDALIEIVRELPADLPAAVFAVIHTSSASPGLLAAILGRASRLPVVYAADGAVARPGEIYLAPPDHHLHVHAGGVMRLTRGPKENAFRPAIDPLFRTAARAYGPRLVGAVLSGFLDDGTLGALEVKRRGGVVVAQDPGEATAPDMPRSVVENVAVDHVVRLAEMTGLFARLTSQPPARTGGAGAMTTTHERGSEEPAPPSPNGIERKEEADGPPTPITCPECGGALWEKQVDRVLQYSCHLGHAYTAESLEDQQIREVEAALWTAVRHLVERAAVHRRLAARMRASDLADRAANYDEVAAETERRAGLIRQLIMTDRVAGLVLRGGGGISGVSGEAEAGVVRQGD